MTTQAELNVEAHDKALDDVCRIWVKEGRPRDVPAAEWHAALDKAKALRGWKPIHVTKAA